MVRHPTLRNRLAILQRTYRYFGPSGISQYYAHRVSAFLGCGKDATDGSISSFDRCYGVDTDASSTQGDLTIASPHTKWGIHYEPSREDILRDQLMRLPIHYEDYFFVDAGAGKGKALLVASGFPFKALEGVEYSEELARIAEENISSFLKREERTSAIRVICKDISNFDFPDIPLVLYLYNPFQGKVMDRVVANLETSLRRKPRDLWVLYVTPWEDRKFGRSPLLRCVESSFDHSLYRSVAACQ